MLRPAMPGDALDDRGRVLARAGWEALRDYLADLADLRPRLDNQMPTMPRALTRFDHAMGATYGQANPVGMGVHGQRVIAQAGAAGETMSDADAAELRTFAAALALFLERFPEWRAYRDDPAAPPVDPGAVASSLQRIAEIAEALSGRAEIDDAIPESLVEQVGAARDAPGDALVARGLLASAQNVLSRLGAVALRWVRAEAKDIAGKSWAGVKGAIVAGTVAGVTGLGGAAIDLFANHGTVLLWLAKTFPDKFGWLVNLLQALGL